MTGINENKKAQIKQLESAIKDAYKGGNYDLVQSLATQIKDINPEDRLGAQLLGKVGEAKAEALKKEKAAKTKQYESMLTKLYKEGNFENFRKLASEFKLFDSQSKAIDSLLAKVAKAEIDAKRKANEGRISELEKILKTAFKAAKFDEVRNLAAKLNELEPGNKCAAGYLSEIGKAQMEAKRKENAEKINAFQDSIKASFKGGRFDGVRSAAQKLAEIDPLNSFGKKYLVKVAEIEAKVEKEKAKAVKPAVVTLKAVTAPAVKIAAPAKKEESVSIFTKIFGKKEKPAKPAVVTPKTVVVPIIMAEPKVAAAAPKLTVTQSIEKKAPDVPKSAAATPKEEKGNIFTRIFGKKEKPAKPAVVTPKTVVVPIIMAEPKVAAAAPKLTVTQSIEKKAPEMPKITAAAPKEDKGNIFTRMFGKKEELEKPKESIIDTIVAKTAETRAKVEEKPKEEKEKGLVFAGFSKALMQFSMAFIVISLAFFYVQNIDQNNTVLGLFGVKDNYASRLHAAAQTLDEKKAQESGLNTEISDYKEGYNNKYEAIIQDIVAKRVEWPVIMVKINEIADFVYARNAISQYIKFNNFSLDTATGQVRVSGTLSDPLGKNLTKLAEIEDAFRYFPKDKTNAEDTTKPYFYNVQELNSLSKSYDSRTGKYTSNFQMAFSLTDQPTQ